MPEHSTLAATKVPPRATTPLLTLITQESLDEDYEHVAQRRAATGGGDDARRRRRPRLVATAVVAVFGLLVAVAAAQTSERSGVESASRSTLIAQIASQRAHVAKLQRQTVRLRETNIGLQDQLNETSAKADAAQARVDRLAAVTGFGAVSGPGLVITVGDSPDGEAVRDEDLALLVNGLWQAGAEAIAINGKRLTARSALRNSGAAINLNGPPPLSPPYVVSAIGDNRTLQADLLETSTGLTFTSVAESFGFQVTWDNVDRVSLPAAPQRLRTLQYAEQGTAADKAAQRKEITP